MRFLQKLGADLTINYKNTDFEAAIATLTEARGQSHSGYGGRKLFSAQYSAAARGGRIVNIAHLEARAPRLICCPSCSKT